MSRAANARVRNRFRRASSRRGSEDRNPAQTARRAPLPHFAPWRHDSPHCRESATADRGCGGRHPPATNAAPRRRSVSAFLRRPPPRSRSRPHVRAAFEHDLEHLVGIIMVNAAEQELPPALRALRAERRERAVDAPGLQACQFHHQRFALGGGEKTTLAAIVVAGALDDIALVEKLLQDCLLYFFD